MTAPSVQSVVVGNVQDYGVSAFKVGTAKCAPRLLTSEERRNLLKKIGEKKKAV